MKNRGTLMMASFVAALFCMAPAAMAQTPADSGEGRRRDEFCDCHGHSDRHRPEDARGHVKTTDGKDYSFIAGDAVKNLAQVAVGDIITATYTEALLYEVKSGGTTGASTAVATARAAGGDKPAGIVGQETTVTVVITAIDTATPSVTFKGPAGNVRTIKVQQPEKLKGVKVGDTVDITYAESVAVSVEKAKK